MDVVDIILWLIIAYFAGTAASTLIERRKVAGRLRIRNTILGGLGAFVGQVIFDALDLDLGEFFAKNISLGEITVAFIGAVVVLAVLRSLR